MQIFSAASNNCALSCICKNLGGSRGRPEQAKEQQATALIESLNDLRGDYQCGSIDYASAQYYASIGDDTNALSRLQESVAQGNYFVPGSFKNDIPFLNIKDSPEFQEILTYWHKFLK